jgi:hypothetical protein
VTVSGGGSATASANDTTTIITAGQEIGSLDTVGDSNGLATIAQGQTLFVRGWAADTITGAPVQSVTIKIDGVSVGTATLGIARPDVANAYNRIDYANSGWSFQMSTSSLSVASHTVAAVAAGTSGTAQVGVKRPSTSRHKVERR